MPLLPRATRYWTRAPPSGAWKLLRDPIRLEFERQCDAHVCRPAQPQLRYHPENGYRALQSSARCRRTRCWAGPGRGARSLFSALDAGGCAVTRLVRIDNGELYPARPLKLFMITNNAAIAESDCLFYAVADDGSAICSWLSLQALP